MPVLVIDDASEDDTIVQAINAGARVLPLAAHLGSWGAIQAGMRYAVELNVDIAITMDADGQHLAECLPRLIAPLKTKVADVVIGSYIKRMNGTKLTVWKIFRTISGLGIEDLTSGFRSYNRKSLQILASVEASLLDYQDVGVLMLLREAGLCCIEVQVNMLPRSNGNSKIFNSWLQIMQYVITTLVLCVSKWKR
jgi:glycosyltransferase involved in cell wall biosynthesis